MTDSALQAVTLLRHLQSEHPLAFPDDRIRRTLERRVRRWRALNGPERDIIFRQTPEPGYMARSGFTRSDFTHAEELEVTFAGQSFPHLLYHFVMVYSRRENVGVVLGGESFTALAENLQQALWSLGGAPQNHRTDAGRPAILEPAMIRPVDLDQCAQTLPAEPRLMERPALLASLSSVASKRLPGSGQPDPGELMHRRVDPVVGFTTTRLVPDRIRTSSPKILQQPVDLSSA